jgi:hypothetical protein
VVRGYLAGSGWKEYQDSQSVCGVPLPAGLKNASKLPEPIYTPAAKAEAGEHDENITFEKTVEMIGPAIWPPASATSASPSTRPPPRLRCRRASSLPTPSSSSGWTATARWC